MVYSRQIQNFIRYEKLIFFFLLRTYPLPFIKLFDRDQTAMFFKITPKHRSPLHRFLPRIKNRRILPICFISPFQYFRYHFSMIRTQNKDRLGWMHVSSRRKFPVNLSGNFFNLPHCIIIYIKYSTHSPLSPFYRFLTFSFISFIPNVTPLRGSLSRPPLIWETLLLKNLP